MSTEMLVAVVSAGVALVGAGASVWGQLRIARLQVQMQEKKEAKQKAEQAEAVLSRYREPLVQAAFELQSRIFNFLRSDILARFYDNGSEREKAYVVDNSAFVVAQYLGWTEIARREIQFLDLGAMQATKRLAELQDDICNVLLSNKLEPNFMVFRGEQRAIGECMIVEKDGGSQCMGYAAFCRNRDPDFTRWFSKLREDVPRLPRGTDQGAERLVELQHALVELIDFLDPDCVRFPRKRRSKV